jgi:inorganic triphosphatase YgiF
MNQEIELKLELEVGSAAAVSRHPIVADLQSRTTGQISTYYDTASRHISAAGFSLRVREKGDKFIQTIKQANGAGAGLFNRPEWEVEIDGAQPSRTALNDTPLRKVISEKRWKKLQPVSQSRVERTTWLAEFENSTIEVTFDEGEVKSGKKRQRFVELELELKEGAASAIFAAARALAGDIPVRIGVLTKDQRGQSLENGTAGKVAKAEPIPLSPEMNAGAGFIAIASGCLRHFRLNEPVVLKNRDPGALHQMRVAMRRLRSAFTLFRPVIIDPRYLELREELRWFTDQLGDARNIDVLLARYSKIQGKGSKALRTRLKAARSDAYERVLDTLASARFRAFTLDQIEWLTTGDWLASPAADGPLRSFAEEALDKRWRKVKKGGRDIAALMPKPLHDLRIEVKKLRYAVEFFASLHLAKRASARRKSAESALAELQEVLGLMNDDDTARAILPELLSGEPQALLLAKKQLKDSHPLTRAVEAHRRLMKAGPFWRLSPASDR